MKKMNLKYQPFTKVFRLFLAGIFMIVTPVFAQAQNKAITGVVSDEHKIPLSGVTVSVKGTKVATMTDFNGQFKISASPKDQLVFTYVSFETTTVTVGDRSSINVGLKSSTSSLDEIVVIGYGTRKRKDLTGSVASVSMADIHKAPVRSFDEALAGRVAGVQVTSADGRPGSGIDIVIRGNNSVTQANSPLYVIDGFPIENFDNNALNPAEIESIDVLKDASATAIYGARGANGVIVIQTKKGKTGKAVWTFNSATGIQQINNKMDLLSPYEYVKYQLELDPTLSSGGGLYRTPTEIYLTGPKRTLESYRNSESINWMDLITRNALFQNNDFAVRGGGKKLKYSVSGSSTKQTGIVYNSEYQRYQGRTILDYKVTDKLTVGINANYSYMVPKGMDPSRGSNGARTNLMTSVWGARPIPDPKINLIEEEDDPDINPANDYRVNPILTVKNTYDVSTKKSFLFNGYLEYLILKNLKIRSTYGFTDNKSERARFFNEFTREGRNGSNGRIDNDNSSSWVNENTVYWDKKVGKSSFNVLGGFTVQNTKSWGYGRGATKVPTNSIDDLDLGVPTRIDPSSSNSTMASFLTRVDYNYDSRYMVTVSMRADGSSKFPSENHWGYFPSGSLVWNFKNEKFLKKNKVISAGKLQSSYGQTGNNRVGDFSYLTTYFNSIGNSYVFDDQYSEGVVPTNLGNSQLKWETTEQVNAALSMGFFNQRIDFIAEVYRKRTIDLLLNSKLAPSAGFTQAYKNIGSVENKGLEFTLTTKNIVTKDFTWTTSGNISFNRNTLLALDEGQTTLETGVNWDNNVGTTAFIAEIGKPLGNMYGLQWDGTYKYSDFDISVNSSGATTYSLKSDVTENGNVRTSIKPGDVKYKDLDGDKKITNADNGIIGNGLPKHYGGISNNFTYKGFDLNVFFQWSYGNDVQNMNRQQFGGLSPGNAKNQFAEVANRWTPSNPNSDLMSIRGSYGGYSTFTVEDGSYLRLKTIALGYNVDSDIVNKWRLKSLRFSLSAQNLVTWTKYSGPDPEVNSYRSVLTPGFDYSAYPRALTVNLGVNLSF